MVASITQKSSNTLENQGDKSLKTGAPSEASLFDQFSEILDKIATSLNYAKQKRDSQNIRDLSDSLSQAAAQQMTQRAAVVEHKPSVELSSKPAVETSNRSTPIAEQKGESEQIVDTLRRSRQENLASNTNSDSAQSDAATQQSESTLNDKPVVEQDQAGAQVVTAQTSAESSVPADAAAEVNVQPVSPEHEAPVVSVEGEQVAEEVEVSVDEESAPQLKAASVASDNSKPQAQVAAPVTPVVDAEQPGSSQAAIQPAPVMTDSQSAAPVTETDAQSQPVESRSVTTDSLVEISKPSGEDFVPVHPDASKADLSGEVDARQLLLQSAQALINQALSLSPTRQLLDAAVSQKLLTPGQAVQGVTSGAANGQSVASPLLQNKFTQSAPEKSAARELSRPQALRTMERVESALKEAARSKDGKTISLRLDPPSLGSVKIDLTLKDGQLHARFVAESAQVNALLRDQSHELHQILRRAGVQADRVTVSIAGEVPIDLSQNFQSFDQTGTKQFGESSRSGGDFGSGIEVGAETAATVTATVQPTDHWVA